MDIKIFTISEITSYIKKLLTEDLLLSNLWVTGEISNFHHHNSGHMYFTLKDSNCALSSIMFRGNNRNLKFEIEDGMMVNVHGHIGLYEPRGNYQFYIDQLEPAGKGALYLAYEQLKARLEKEGLFAQEEKKEIPLLPRKIGLITSPTGAALRDILSVAKRRFNDVSVLIVPTLVQGEQAAPQIVRGLEYLNDQDDIDLIIISRGGGSIEDLWPFNEEIVARAIHRSTKAVIAGIGHETDFTIADFVADLRAPTPSAAAELAISSRLDLEKTMNTTANRLFSAIQNRLDKDRDRLEALAAKRIFTRPTDLLSKQMQKVDDLVRRLEWEMERKINKEQEKFRILTAKLEGLSPLNILSRGYSITSKNGQVINKADKLMVGDYLSTRLKKGIVYSRIEAIEEGDDLDG